MIAMAVAIGAFCIPVVFGSRHIPYDFEGYNFPLWKFTFNSFREGSFPVLDPFVYSGVPFLAETQSGIFYPLNGGLLYLASWWLRDLSVGQVQWINGLHMLIGGAGAYVLGRLYGASSLRAFAIAMLILFSGVPLANQQHPGILAAGAWLPWLLISIELIITSASFLATAGFAVVVALIITIGNLPHALVILLVGGIYALTRLVALMVAQDWRMPWTQLGLLLAEASWGHCWQLPFCCRYWSSCPGRRPLRLPVQCPYGRSPPRCFRVSSETSTTSATSLGVTSLKPTIFRGPDSGSRSRPPY